MKAIMSVPLIQEEGTTGNSSIQNPDDMSASVFVISWLSLFYNPKLFWIIEQREEELQRLFLDRLNRMPILLFWSIVKKAFRRVALHKSGLLEPVKSNGKVIRFKMCDGREKTKEKFLRKERETRNQDKKIEHKLLERVCLLTKCWLDLNSLKSEQRVATPGQSAKGENDRSSSTLISSMEMKEVLHVMQQMKSGQIAVSKVHLRCDDCIGRGIEEGDFDCLRRGPLIVAERLWRSFRMLYLLKLPLHAVGERLLNQDDIERILGGMEILLKGMPKQDRMAMQSTDEWARLKYLENELSRLMIQYPALKEDLKEQREQYSRLFLRFFDLILYMPPIAQYWFLSRECAYVFWVLVKKCISLPEQLRQSRTPTQMEEAWYKHCLDVLLRASLPEKACSIVDRWFESYLSFEKTKLDALKKQVLGLYAYACWPMLVDIHSSRESLMKAAAKNMQKVIRERRRRAIERQPKITAYMGESADEKKNRLQEWKEIWDSMSLWSPPEEFFKQGLTFLTVCTEQPNLQLSHLFFILGLLEETQSKPFSYQLEWEKIEGYIVNMIKNYPWQVENGVQMEFFLSELFYFLPYVGREASKQMGEAVMDLMGCFGSFSSRKRLAGAFLWFLEELFSQPHHLTLYREVQDTIMIKLCGKDGGKTEWLYEFMDPLSGKAKFKMMYHLWSVRCVDQKKCVDNSKEVLSTKFFLYCTSEEINSRFWTSFIAEDFEKSMSKDIEGTMKAFHKGNSVLYPIDRLKVFESMKRHLVDGKEDVGYIFSPKTLLSEWFCYMTKLDLSEWDFKELCSNGRAVFDRFALLKGWPDHFTQCKSSELQTTDQIFLDFLVERLLSLKSLISIMESLYINRGSFYQMTEQHKLSLLKKVKEVLLEMEEGQKTKFSCEIVRSPWFLWICGLSTKFIDKPTQTNIVLIAHWLKPFLGWPEHCRVLQENDQLNDKSFVEWMTNQCLGWDKVDRMVFLYEHQNLLYLMGNQNQEEVLQGAEAYLWNERELPSSKEKEIWLILLCGLPQKFFGQNLRRLPKKGQDVIDRLSLFSGWPDACKNARQEGRELNFLPWAANKLVETCSQGAEIATRRFTEHEKLFLKMTVKDQGQILQGASKQCLWDGRPFSKGMENSPLFLQLCDWSKRVLKDTDSLLPDDLRTMAKRFDPFSKWPAYLSKKTKQNPTSFLQWIAIQWVERLSENWDSTLENIFQNEELFYAMEPGEQNRILENILQKAKGRFSDAVLSLSSDCRCWLSQLNQRLGEDRIGNFSWKSQCVVNGSHDKAEGWVKKKIASWPQRKDKKPNDLLWVMLSVAPSCTMQGIRESFDCMSLDQKNQILEVLSKYQTRGSTEVLNPHIPWLGSLQGNLLFEQFAKQGQNFIKSCQESLAQSERSSEERVTLDQKMEDFEQACIESGPVSEDLAASFLGSEEQFYQASPGAQVRFLQILEKNVENGTLCLPRTLSDKSTWLYKIEGTLPEGKVPVLVQTYVRRLGQYGVWLGEVHTFSQSQKSSSANRIIEQIPDVISVDCVGVLYILRKQGILDKTEFQHRNGIVQHIARHVESCGSPPSDLPEHVRNELVQFIQKIEGEMDRYLLQNQCVLCACIGVQGWSKNRSVQTWKRNKSNSRFDSRQTEELTSMISADPQGVIRGWCSQECAFLFLNVEKKKWLFQTLQVQLGRPSKFLPDLPVDCACGLVRLMKKLESTWEVNDPSKADEDFVHACCAAHGWSQQKSYLAWSRGEGLDKQQKEDLTLMISVDIQGVIESLGMNKSAFLERSSQDQDWLLQKMGTCTKGDPIQALADFPATTSIQLIQLMKNLAELNISTLSNKGLHFVNTYRNPQRWSQERSFRAWKAGLGDPQKEELTLMISMDIQGVVEGLYTHQNEYLKIAITDQNWLLKTLIGKLGSDPSQFLPSLELNCACGLVRLAMALKEKGMDSFSQESQDFVNHCCAARGWSKEQVCSIMQCLNQGFNEWKKIILEVISVDIQGVIGALDEQSFLCKDPKQRNYLLQTLAEQLNGGFSQFLSNLGLGCACKLVRLTTALKEKGVDDLSLKSQSFVNYCNAFHIPLAKWALENQSSGWTDALSDLLFSDFYGVSDYICTCWKQLGGTTRAAALRSMVNMCKNLPHPLVSSNCFKWLSYLEEDEENLPLEIKDFWAGCFRLRKVFLLLGDDVEYKVDLLRVMPVPACFENPPPETVEEREERQINQVYRVAFLISWTKGVETLCEHDEWLYRMHNPQSIFCTLMKALSDQQSSIDQQGTSECTLSSSCGAWLQSLLVNLQDKLNDDIKLFIQEKLVKVALAE